MKNFNRSIKVPFTVYADFEAIQEKQTSTDSSLHSTEANRKILTKHIPSQFGYYISSTIDSFSHTPVHYRGHNADKMFVDSLVKTLVTNEDPIYNKYFSSKKLIAPKPTHKFTETAVCSICSQAFAPNQLHVVNHDHFTGDFLGYAH